MTEILYDEEIINNLNEICYNNTNKGQKIEGNCLYKNMYSYHQGAKLILNESKNRLRHNLYKLGNISSVIIEVGFNAGHSAAIMINKESFMYVFDLCCHRYTKKCFEYLNSKYKNMYLIEGDSNKTFSNFKTDKKIDLIHIDGGHGIKTAENDIINSLRLSNENTFIILDDTNSPDLNNLADNYISKNLWYEIDYEKHNLYKIEQHRIFKIIN